jgi:hypothetical protein
MLAEVYGEMWKDGVKVKAFLNVKDGILSKERVEARNLLLLLLLFKIWTSGGGVVVKALCYKPAGRGFDSRWCHWNFSVT